MGAPNNFRFTSTAGCVGAASSGVMTSPDAVYAVSVPARTRLTVRLHNGAGASTVFDSIFSIIPDLPSCGVLGAGDAGTVGINCAASLDVPQPQILQYANAGPAARQVYLLIDGYGPADQGAYAVDVSFTPLVQGDRCEWPLPVDAGTAASTGLASYVADYAGRGTLCASSTSSSGPDSVYELVVPGGQRLVATVSPAAGLDTSLSLTDSVTACNQRVCLNSSNGGGTGVPETMTLANFQGTPKTVFLIVDTPAAAPVGAYTLATSVTPIAAGDTCSNAVGLTLGAQRTMETFMGSYSDYGSGGFRCPTTSGPDRAYSVTLPAGQRLTVAVSPRAGLDTTLSIIPGTSVCSSNACVAGNDDGAAQGGPAAIDTAVYDNATGAAQPLFIVVDSVPGADQAILYDVSATATPLPSPAVGESCALAATAVAGANPAVNTAAFAVNHAYSLTGTRCAFYQGFDYVYSFSVPAGQRLTVAVNSASDAVVNLVQGPASQCSVAGAACLDGSDANSSGTETATWLNGTTTAQTVYAIIGHWQTQALTFTATFTLQ